MKNKKPFIPLKDERFTSAVPPILDFYLRIEPPSKVRAVESHLKQKPFIPWDERLFRGATQAGFRLYLKRNPTFKVRAKIHNSRYPLPFYGGSLRPHLLGYALSAGSSRAHSVMPVYTGLPLSPARLVSVGIPTLPVQSL